MNGKILALLLSVALTVASGAAQARNDSKFRASAEAVVEAQNNPVLPPAADRNIATTLAAWTHTFKTMFDPRTVAKSCLARAVYFEARSESQLGQLAVAMVILNRVEGYELSVLHLRRGLPGGEPPECLPVFLCLRWPTGSAAIRPRLGCSSCSDLNGTCR